MSQFFSFSGRVRRMTFWINVLLFGALGVALQLMFVDMYANWYTGEVTTVISNKPVYYIGSLIVFVRNASIWVRRFHDMNYSWIAPGIGIAFFALSRFFPNQYENLGMATFLTVVMGIASLVMIGFMGFHPGDKGENDYGPAPEDGQWL